jgi:hypothetical protein
MAAYATVPPGDPFAVSKGMFAALAGELAGPAAAVLTACELEDLLDERGREVVRQLLQDHFDLRRIREEQQAREHPGPVDGADGITRARLEAGHGRLLATLFGTVTVTRCAWRKPGAPDYLPADAVLSLPAGRHSHTLAKLAALEAARGSFEAAHAAIARRCGPVIGKRQIEDSVVRSAAGIPAFYAARVPEPCTPAALLVLSADCKGIVMRPGALRAATAKAAAKLGKMRTRLTAGEKPNRKRMAALVAVYDAEPARRRPHDVIAPPGGRAGARPLRPGPKALARAEGTGQVAGRVRPQGPRGHDRRRVRRGRGPRPAPPADLGRPGRRRGAPAGPHPRRGRPPRRHHPRHHRHNSRPGYLWGAAWSLHQAGDPAAEDWVAAKALAVLGGDSDRAAQEIAAEAAEAGLAASQRNGAAACVRYLENKRECLRYDQALDAGWPIATGVIEGACRHLIADRLDIGGARWGLDGAEAVLTLRAVIASGDFEEYWRFHLKCEHQRLYPGVKQGQYALGA